LGINSEDFFTVQSNLGIAEQQLALIEMPPLVQVERRGRPRWEKAAEYQTLVEAMCDFDASLAQIEAAVGVSAPTLRRFFYRLPAWQAWSLRRRNHRSQENDRP
jgi:hypothetical protein